jgi:RNA polymerase sigma factor (sigma-70 family)
VVVAPRRPGLDDRLLVERAQQGDVAAYEELVTRYQAVAHRTAFLLGAGGDAEDVVQEAFVKGYRALGRFDTTAPFRPWLLRIVANEARNRHRSSSRRSALAVRLARAAPESDGSPPDPQDAVVTEERRARLLAEIAGLPEKQRLVVTCRYLLELSEQETADVLSWPPGSVKSRLARALERLRTSLPEPEHA